MKKFNGIHHAGILLAAMPKSGSTLTSSYISEFPLIRNKYYIASGIEQVIDLKILEIRIDQNTTSSFVSQHHVCYTNILRRIINEGILIPVILTRNLPDAIISHIDHYRKNPEEMENFLGILPRDFNAFPMEEKIDHIIRFHLTWHLRFFKSWISYPGFRDHWVRYEDLLQDRASFLRRVSGIIGLDPQTNPAYLSDSKFSGLVSRFNMGVPGRGRHAFTESQLKLVHEMIVQYEIPDIFHDYLETGSSSVEMPTPDIMAGASRPA